MNTNEYKTEPLSCYRCQFEVRMTDRFCRRCGIAQPADAARLPTRDLSGPLAAKSYDTGRLLALPADHRVSGRLMGLLATSLPQTSGTLATGVIGRHVMPLLISLPIWLLLVLLSPLDAWMTARCLARQI